MTDIPFRLTPHLADVNPSKARTDLLTTTQLYYLDQACQLVSKAFGGRPPYLVGTAGVGGAELLPRRRRPDDPRQQRVRRSLPDP